MSTGTILTAGTGVIRTFWDTTSNRQFMKDYASMLSASMVAQKEAILEKVYARSVVDAADNSPEFAAAIDWYLEHK